MNDKRVRFSETHEQPKGQEKQQVKLDSLLDSIELFLYSICFMISLAIGWKNNTEAKEAINMFFILLMMPVLFIPMVLASISKKTAIHFILASCLTAVQSLLLCLYLQHAANNRQIAFFALCLVSAGSPVMPSLSISKTVVGIFHIISIEMSTLSKVSIGITLIDGLFCVVKAYRKVAKCPFDAQSQPFLKQNTFRSLKSKKNKTPSTSIREEQSVKMLTNISFKRDEEAEALATQSNSTRLGGIRIEVTKIDLKQNKWTQTEDSVRFPFRNGNLVGPTHPD